MAAEQKTETTESSRSIKDILQDAKVTGKDDKEVSVEDLKKYDVVGFYFSAHWCPPCRRFTPMLKQAYETLRKDKADCFEVIFVSSDQTEAEANSYYNESHPWTRINWTSTTKHKRRLGAELEAGNGIPSLVLVDPKTGDTITKDGTGGFWGNTTGKGFPFKPRSFEEIMSDGAFKNKKGKEFSYADLAKDFDYVMFYFSAHWCPPCRAFTPKFIEWYKKNQSKMKAGKTFEVIFMSSDKDESQFDEYYGEMPWATTKAWKDARTDELKKMFGVNGIPSVQVIDLKTGKVAEPNGCGGRSGVTTDPDAEKFPWPKEPAGNLMMALDNINEKPVVIVMAGKEDANITKALMEVGQPYLKAGGKMEMEFAIEDGTTSDRVLAQVKNLFKMKEGETLIVTDLGKGQFFKPKEAVALDKIDKACLTKLIADFKAGADTLENTSLG